MQSLGSEYQVNIGCAFADLGAFLAGDTAPHSDNQIGVLLLQVLPAAQLMEHFFLRFFPNGTGIEQQHISFVGGVCWLKPVAGVQQVSHPSRVILVHLAAVRLNKQLFGTGVSHVSSV